MEHRATGGRSVQRADPPGVRCELAGRIDNGMPITTLVDEHLHLSRKSVKLSEFELDLMTHFWRDRELSAPELFERVGGERGVTYSTVKTIIDRLEEKGALERVASRGRTIFYAPAIKQERIRKPLVKAFLRRLFGHDLRPLFAQLLRDEKLSDEDLDYLRQLIDDKRGKK
jgi:BlaI family penicillinase repressor